MRSKKVWSLVLCFCMLMSLLTGCGLGGQQAELDGPVNVEAESDTENGGDALEEEILLADESEINYETNLVKQEADKSDAKSDGSKAEESKADAEDKSEGKNQTPAGDKIVNAEDLEEDPLLQLIDQNMKGEEEAEDNRNQSADSSQDLPFDQQQPDVFEDGLVEYADNTLMVKVKKSLAETMGDELKEAGVGKLDLMFELEDHIWYTAYLLKDTDVDAVLEAVRGLACVETAEYNFKYEAASVTDIENVDTNAVVDAVSQNPQFADQWYMNDFGILEGWTHAAASGNGMAKDMVVAVIDTGVDYTHTDLKANMWVNTGEIEGNGIDDDSNGYVDDYYGVDMTAKRGSAMDDHGHGTHVAGIIGASNNKEGIVGLAYDAKIMAIKAGDASGYFLQDNVAKSIIYAYDKGADVINMSFGGSASSIAVQDALEVAYTRCVLVASAGNEGSDNKRLPNYPAAHKYVLGVMSVGANPVESAFTNYDVYEYSSVEYEVYAPGEQILSTLPGDRYAKLSGTSMAAPVVSAQAAILRSMYPDRDTYPTKYIYAQISGTAEDVVACYNPEIHGLHNIPGLTNYYLSMTKMPVPEIGMSDYTLFDTETFVGDTTGVTSNVEFTNNGDGIVDAGEVIALGMTLKNRWGMSENTKIHIDATSDLGVEHPYVTFLNNDINYGEIGTYSENDGGKLYSSDSEMWTGWKNPFYIKIAENIPNDYTVRLNVTITYENGLDETDETVYTSKSEILLKVRRGTVISGQITEDMTLTKDHYYIIPTSTIIMEGVTVTVEPGTQIQFWCSDPEDSYAENGIATLQVYGSFITNGTADEPVEIFPSGWMDKYRVEIYGSGSNSYVELNHTKVVNPYLHEIDVADGCEFTQNYKALLKYRELSGSNVRESSYGGKVDIDNVSDSVFYKLGSTSTATNWIFYVHGNYDRCIFIDSSIRYKMESAVNCIFYGNNNYWEESSGSPSDFIIDGNRWDNITVKFLCRNDNTGITYMAVVGLFVQDVRERFFDFVGIDTVIFDTPEEFNYVVEHSEKGYYHCGIYDKDGILYNHNGTELILDNADLTFSATSITHSKTDVVIYIDNRVNSGYYYTCMVEIPGEIYVTNIKFDKYLVDLDMGQTYQIHAELTPATADKNTLVYESLNENVVTVDENGLVTPVGQGTAAVKVYSPDYAVSNYVTFNVKEVIPLEGIQIEEESIYLNIGEEYKLNLDFSPGNTTEKNVEYITSDDSVAVVSPVGVITAVGSGSCKITVTGEEGINDSVTVNVEIPVESISFTEDTYVTDLEKEDGTDFYPVFMPENTTQRELVWESSNPEVCYVNDEGKLVKLKIGTAELKATVKGTDISAMITIAVIEDAVDANVIKILASHGYSSGSGDCYALMDNGDVWAWGTWFTTPKKLSITGAKDICYWYRSDISQIAGFYVLNENGEVNQYKLPDIDGICQKDETIILKDIAAFDSSEGAYYQSVYAIAKDGSLWVWGNNSNGNLGFDTSGAKVYDPVQLNFEPKVAKLVAAYGGGMTFLLTEDGDVYRVGQGAVTKVYSDAVDIYTYNGDITVDFGETVSCYTYFSSDGSDPYKKVHETEKIPSWSIGYYIEEGKVFLNNNRQNQDLYTEVPGIENVTNVFWFEYNQYFQTSDGKFYAMGSAERNALGTGQTANAAEPVRMYFGLTENMNGLSVKATNMSYTDSFGDNILLEDNLTLEWTQALQTSNKWAYITLTDSEGQQTTFYKELNLNKLIIKPRSGFVDGETYTLTIPANAFKDRVKATNAAYALTFTYYDSQQTVAKMMEYKPSATASFKLALLEDGSMWVWGCDTENDVVYETPTAVFSEDVKDFVISQDGQMYILDTEGTVSKYLLKYNDFLEELEKDETFVLDAEITALSAETDNYGSFFAITEDGTVWAWGVNSHNQLGTNYDEAEVIEPVNFTVSDYQDTVETVVKIVSRQYGTGFLMEDGSYYTSGGLSGTTPIYTLVESHPVLDDADELVEDIYADTQDPNCLFCDASDTAVPRENFAGQNGAGMEKMHKNEYIGTHRHYIEDGLVHIIKWWDDSYFQNSTYGDGDTLNLTCATKVFDFGENVYVQTAHGQFYAFGESDNYGLGQKAETGSSEPVKVRFDKTAADTENRHETPAVVKVMTDTDQNAIYQRFALLEDGSLWMWGGSHEETVMLFDRGVEDFMICTGAIYVLDSEGIVTKYITDSDFAYSLKKDIAFEPLTGIKCLADEPEAYTGACYAVNEEGNVLIWSYSDKTIREFNLEDKIVKAVCGKASGIFLTRAGEIYYLKQGTVITDDYGVLEEIKASDIILEDDGVHVRIELKDGSAVRWNSWYNEFAEFEEEDPVFEGYEIEETFSFPENFYFTTADGRFYGTGSGENNFLADSTIESSDTPVEIVFTRPEDVKNEAEFDEEKLNQRFYWSAEEVLKKWDEFVDKGLNTRFYSNVILNRLNDDNVESWLRIQAPQGSVGTVYGFGGNYWGTTNMELVNKQILDFDDFSNLVDINEGEILTEAPEDTFPFVVDAYLEIGGEEGEESERVDVVGNQLVTFVVEFNRDMDTEIPLTVRFGSYYPYADYEVAGAYVSPRVWKGTMQLTTIIENGYQLWSVSNGMAAGTDLKLYTDWGRFPFKIDTSAAQAMVMQADSTVNGINLTWMQDDFETLAGYNVYRSDAEDGYYTRLNQYVIPADTKEFLDDGVEPGKTYYYNFTVVQSDMSESEPSGKVTATALDTLAPNIYHTPVFNAFTGSSLVISANVTDNVGIHTATLYYRTAGTEEWKTQTMTNYNDKYSAVIPAAEVTLDGLEYYIEATDGISQTYKGSAEDPYPVTVKLAVSASDKGDVDGNGTVDVLDAMIVLMAANDRKNLTADEFARADLDDSGVLEAWEALRILMYANGSIGSILS